MGEPAYQVAAWFGPDLVRLHPALQALHRTGGVLEGPVRITLGRGLAGWIGRRIARRLGVPQDRSEAQLRVAVTHAPDGMHWSRAFDGATPRTSVFTPTGHYPEGHWLERSGAICLRLRVAIEADGGWCWQLDQVRVGGLSLPAPLKPRMRACKRINARGLYCFEVDIAWPGLGTLLRYSGELRRVDAEAATCMDVLPP